MTTPRTLKLRMAIGLLALLGLLVAIYLSIAELSYLTNSDFSFDPVCPSKGCGTVNQSRYVTMFGIPIGVIGAIGYLAILAIDLGWMTRRRLAAALVERGRSSSRGLVQALRRRLAALPVGLVLIGLSGFGFLFTLFLIYLELFKIHDVCFWCMVSAGLMTATFALSLAAWPAERLPGAPARR